MTAEQALASARMKDSRATRFVVRLYDGFDNCWMDCYGQPAEGLDADAAMKLWNEKTEDGTKSTRYGDIDYYAIYPKTVKMVHSEEGNRELGIDTIR